MPDPVPDFAFDRGGPDDPAARLRAAPLVRVVLAGSFATATSRARTAIERLLDERRGSWRYRLVSSCRGSEPSRLAETTLAAGGADLVLLDLDGAIGTVLALVGRLRAAAREPVAFVGIMPSRAAPAAHLYLAAVVDALVLAPLHSASLEWAVTDALRSIPVFADACFADAPGDALAPGIARRH